MSDKGAVTVECEVISEGPPIKLRPQTSDSDLGESGPYNITFVRDSDLQISDSELENDYQLSFVGPHSAELQRI